ncbi:LOW QUALITY PROTEIN: hypothetical protein U9M48_008239 [Paspalum notatum var. saurae]|uniref:Reverse transcriptase Ty1/copia-type domain-containing protein n=1 Tax=Paspalum notatum var. saurae TaxID=547442 RepID=A0AAQ3SPD6_PASNO
MRKWDGCEEQREIGSPGFCQEEGIYYEKTFAPVSHLEAIRILLAFAASKGFKLHFPNGYIEKEVYVRQPPGFESAKFLDRAYKLRKTLYGLKQAPRAWYARLKSFLLNFGFVMGSVDKTFFAEQMSREFEISLMGELQFFLGRSSKALRVPLSIKPSTQETSSRSLPWITQCPWLLRYKDNA